MSLVEDNKMSRCFWEVRKKKAGQGRGRVELVRMLDFGWRAMSKAGCEVSVDFSVAGVESGSTRDKGGCR